MKCNMQNKVCAGLMLTAEGMVSKLISLISFVWGWLIMGAGTILNFFLPAKDMFHVLFLVLITDMVVGLLASRKSKQAFTSDKMRSSFYKLLVYLVVLCLVYTVETTYDFNLTLKVLFGIAYAIEIVSVVANLLILKPDMPFLRLLSGALIGEIASKTNMDKKVVEEILENKQKKREEK